VKDAEKIFFASSSKTTDLNGRSWEWCIREWWKWQLKNGKCLKVCTLTYWISNLNWQERMTSGRTQYNCLWREEEKLLLNYKIFTGMIILYRYYCSFSYNDRWMCYNRQLSCLIYLHIPKIVTVWQGRQKKVYDRKYWAKLIFDSYLFIYFF